jgi:predicted nucleic acid-binding protein
MSIKHVYDTTALLSISLVKKLDLLRKLDIVVFVPVSVMEELSAIGKYMDKFGILLE